jgi:hypothetical protein
MAFIMSNLCKQRPLDFFSLLRLSKMIHMNRLMNECACDKRLFYASFGEIQQRTVPTVLH